VSKQAARIGYLTCAGLVLLRIAIGWHFLYEGVYKFQSTRPGRQPFSAEAYLRHATGPLKGLAARLLEDPDGLERLRWEGAQAWYKAQAERFQEFYEFTDEQREAARNCIADGLEAMKAMFASEDFRARVAQYRRSLAELRQAEANIQTQADAERVQADRAYVEQVRTDLLSMVQHWWDNPHQRGHLMEMLTPEQLAKGPVPPSTRTIDWVNQFITWGLIVVGLGLMAGLLTRLWCLGAAAFLAMFYLAYPPWPWLPPGPATDGHFLFVDRNLIELIAVLVLATTRSGHWVGLDALASKLRRRRRAVAEPGPEPPAADEPAPARA